MITVIVETTIDLAIEGDLLVRLTGDGESELKMPVYLSVFALAQYASPFSPCPCFDIQHSIFQLVLAVDAVYARNTLQFICLMSVCLGIPSHLSDILSLVCSICFSSYTPSYKLEKFKARRQPQKALSTYQLASSRILSRWLFP